MLLCELTASSHIVIPRHVGVGGWRSRCYGLLLPRGGDGSSTCIEWSRAPALPHPILPGRRVAAVTFPQAFVPECRSTVEWMPHGSTTTRDLTATRSGSTHEGVASSPPETRSRSGCRPELSRVGRRLLDCAATSRTSRSGPGRLRRAGVCGGDVRRYRVRMTRWRSRHASRPVACAARAAGGASRGSPTTARSSADRARNCHVDGVAIHHFKISH